MVNRMTAIERECRRGWFAASRKYARIVEIAPIRYDWINRYGVLLGRLPTAKELKEFLHDGVAGNDAALKE